MIIIKGQDVHLQKEDKTWINPIQTYGMIHDPDGIQLDRCYVYIGPFKIFNEEIDLTFDAKKYFGNSYVGTKVIVDVPKGPWKTVGNITQILYRRRGKYSGKYFHFFKKKTLILVSKCKNHLRLEFPSNCVVNWRGFVYP